MKPPGRSLKRPARSQYPPEPESAPMDDGTIAIDPRSAVERNERLVRVPAVQAILDDDTRQQAVEIGLIDAADAEQIAAAMAKRAATKKLTRAQVARIRLTQQALSLKASGYSSNEIAEHLGVNPGTIVGWFATHRRDVQALDLDRQLDEIAVPLATENLIHGLIAGDKDYTLETLKGRGKLKKTQDASEGAHTGKLPDLVIRVEGTGNTQINVGTAAMQGQTPEQIATGGKVVGRPQIPKTVDGQVLGAVRESSGDDSGA